MLKSDYTIIEDRNKKPWCDFTEKFQKTSFPHEVTLPNCKESISQKPYSEVPLPKEITTCCKCPENEVADSSQITDNTPDIQPTRKIAFTSGLTTAGTVGTLLLLYKYTPVSSWFRRRGMNNIGSDLYMNPGSPDGFLRMQHDNGGNNIFYQP
ncbi:hypothetical protein PVC01_000119900 [Plasmodium vivax]|uniref:VIR protein n=1 Tax=Plasmodium vivax TaxID=5855 RepID=A0A1G4EEV1_PLAVI|nr:hypothetical protein PVC01_000119900 [Plasmodium vivax]